MAPSATTEGPPSTTNGSSDFNVVSTYKSLLASDPELTMPVAAIEALVETLAHSHATTISETLALLTTATNALKSAISNPISLSAGTDLFTRYLVSSLRNTGGSDTDFQAVRTHLLSNGRLFVQRAKESREKIASFGRHFVRDGCTVLTNGGSRVVGALLRSAADASPSGNARFRVVYVVHAPSSPGANEGMETVRALREKGVAVATVSEAAVGYSMGMVDMVIVGAEGVVENGGIISRLGTYQMGMLAKSMGRPFYVVAESHKFVRMYPLGQYDLGIEQKVVDFKTSEDDVAEPKGEKLEESATAVDFTPPNLISGIITESGVLTPSAVSEELIKIWF
ncbi:nagb/rpia/CoA transferase-like protein [Rhizodiscina lignyota]|uniref:Translation initiation factor eIF2B subunit alpha n=1 Tax=Rhizodiscina lignyota TaxID=1504668 RepID=A0A9P4IKL5_9PEZI|nr:nagb/rpia/CoA transferase-like protein [Rhizodiscina lignyota]